MNFFINTLSWWQWAILAAIPPAIVALYFLKLRRQPVEVPSTFLWRRTIEDMHVNSLWQRLRTSILLLLQLLLVALAMFALLRPGWQGRELAGNRFVFLVDSSASMSSTDVKPTRLDEAKRRVAEMIDEMKSGDEAMIIEFNDRAIPVQRFTDNRYELRRKLDNIRPTNRTSDLSEALRLAAGLASPGRAGEVEQADEASTEKTHPAELFIFTDGRVGPVTGFDFGSLTPRYVIIGDEQPKNVGIVAFSAERNAEKPDQLQAVVQLQRHGMDVEKVPLTLSIDGRDIDFSEAVFEKGRDSTGVSFDLANVDRGRLEVKVDLEDDLATDNVAFAAVNLPRKARVLVVTPQNDALETALSTSEAVKAAEVTITEPKFLTTKAYLDQATTAAYDLVIFDQCAPEKVMPLSNTLLIGSLPPGTKEVDPRAKPAEEPMADAPPAEAAPAEGAKPADVPPSNDAAAEKPARVAAHWEVGPKQPAPAVIDSDRAHPLMQFIELDNVRIADARPLDPPAGGTKLIDTDIGTIFAVAPREGFEDAVLGFEIVGADAKTGERYANTDWPIRRSFPLFVMNVIHYLGGQGGLTAAGNAQPGKSIALRTDAPVETVTVTSPDREATKLSRDGQAAFTFSKTDELGIYDVVEGKAKQPSQQFAVNLFDARESNIRPELTLKVGEEELTGQSHWEPMRKETWKYLLLIGLGILMAEWWIWNRRVYL